MAPLCTGLLPTVRTGGETPMPQGTPRHRTPPAVGSVEESPVPHGTPRHRTPPHWGSVGGGAVWPLPTSSPSIRDPSATPTPSPNQSLVPILLTTNHKPRQGRGRGSRSPTSQSVPGSAHSGRAGGWVSAAGAASLPKMAPAGLGGGGLQVQGCAVGAGGQDVGDVLPQEAGPVDRPAGRQGITDRPTLLLPPGSPPKWGCLPQGPL